MDIGSTVRYTDDQGIVRAAIIVGRTGAGGFDIAVFLKQMPYPGQIPVSVEQTQPYRIDYVLRVSRDQLTATDQLFT